jgi:hypothetical protein
VSANIALENAIRTGGWAVPIRAGQRRSYGTDPRTNRKFYLVLDGRGDSLGYIANSEERPALMTGGPTYYLKRAPDAGCQ